MANEAQNILLLKVSAVLVLLKMVICKARGKKKKEMERRGHQSERILTLATVCCQEGITKQQVNASVDLSNCFPSLSDKLECPRTQK